MISIVAYTHAQIQLVIDATTNNSKVVGVGSMDYKIKGMCLNSFILLKFILLKYGFVFILDSNFGI